MPSTRKPSDIWEYTLTKMLGHDSKSETGKVLRFWVKCHKLEGYYQLLLWDVDDYTDHAALRSYMQMPSTPSDRCITSGKLCYISLSKHKETWNWTMRTIL